MSVLRVYDPAECDDRGVPLDWEKCRYCEGEGTVLRNYGHTALDGSDTREKQGVQIERCVVCDGYGSLKAAVLAWIEARRENAYERTFGWDPVPVDRPYRTRCEDCGHLMSEGMWERQPLPGLHSYPPEESTLSEAARCLSEGLEPGGTMLSTHYSPCDEGCRHGGSGRRNKVGFTEWKSVEVDTESTIGYWTGIAGQRFEASWRPVDVRTLGWHHDLRTEKLAVLCLRCWAARSAH